jgi:hypothetical protein
MSRKRHKQFRVGTSAGDDFHPAEMEALELRIAAWYGSAESNRNYPDPLEAASTHIRQCLLAQTSDGSEWMRCPEDFAIRIKTRCMFDMKEGKGLIRASQKDGQPVQDGVAVKLAHGQADRDSIASSFDRDLHELDTIRKILADYPELDTAVSRPHVERLALYYAEQELIKQELKIIGNVKKRPELIRSLAGVEQSAERTMEMLDIHPNQLRSKMRERKEGTLGDLIAVLEGDDTFLEREQLWALQAALQFYWMTRHANGHGDGPQIADWELWHFTRTLPMDYTCSCGKKVTLVRGFTPVELREYLIERGVMIEEPAIPGLIAAPALAGLATHPLTTEHTNG